MDVELNNTKNIQITSAIKTILSDELKNYELESRTAELFARTYELIALSSEVDGLKNFQYNYQIADKGMRLKRDNFQAFLKAFHLL